MRIAIPQWEKRVSPILDDAGTLVLVDTETGGADHPSVVPLAEAGSLERVRFLQRLAVDYVICGAVSRELKLQLDAAGIMVLANTCGSIDDVTRSFLARYAGGPEKSQTKNTRRSAPDHLARATNATEGEDPP